MTATEFHKPVNFWCRGLKPPRTVRNRASHADLLIDFTTPLTAWNTREGRPIAWLTDSVQGERWCLTASTDFAWFVMHTQKTCARTYYDYRADKYVTRTPGEPHSVQTLSVLPECIEHIEQAGAVTKQIVEYYSTIQRLRLERRIAFEVKVNPTNATIRKQGNIMSYASHQTVNAAELLEKNNNLFRSLFGLDPLDPIKTSDGLTLEDVKNLVELSKS